VVGVNGNGKEPIHSDLSAVLAAGWRPSLETLQTLERWYALRVAGCRL
jgi:hypothetical protein